MATSFNVTFFAVRQHYWILTQMTDNPSSQSATSKQNLARKPSRRFKLRGFMKDTFGILPVDIVGLLAGDYLKVRRAETHAAPDWSAGVLAAWH